MRTRLFDVLGVVAVTAMVVSLVMLVREYETGFGELALDVSQEDLEAGFREGYEYHAIYAGAQKVGTMRTERRHNGDGYRLRSEMELVIDVGLARQTTFTEVDAYLDPDFRLERFHAETRGGVLSLAVDGFWDGDAMVVSGLPGEQGTRAFPLPEAPFILHSLRPVLMRSNLERGDRVSFEYYDPIGQRPITADVTYLGREEIELMGTTLEAFRFRQTALGQQSEVYVNALGEVLIEELPMGFRAVREPEAEARFGLREGPVGDASARGDGLAIDPSPLETAALDRPRWSRASLVLDTLGGFDGGLTAPGHKLAVGAERRPRIEITAAETTLPPQILIEKDVKFTFAPDLGETLVINAHAPAVRSAMETVVAPLVPTTSDRVRLDEQADALARWVHREIAYVPGGDRLESAAAVLDAGEGDAAGKAHLLAALLRAAEIPARVARGAVVVGGDAPGTWRLVEHTWVEAWLGRWVGLDPTLGMIPVDAGYLRLHLGEKAADGLSDATTGELRFRSIDGE